MYIVLLKSHHFLINQSHSTLNSVSPKINYFSGNQMCVFLAHQQHRMQSLLLKGEYSLFPFSSLLSFIVTFPKRLHVQNAFCELKNLDEYWFPSFSSQRLKLSLIGVSLLYENRYLLKVFHDKLNLLRFPLSYYPSFSNVFF